MMKVFYLTIVFVIVLPITKTEKIFAEIFGPAFDEIILPVRYFYVQIKNENGEK